MAQRGREHPRAARACSGLGFGLGLGPGLGLGLRLRLGSGLGLRLGLRLGFAGAARTKEAAQLAAHARLLVDPVGEHGREAEVPRREEPLAPARGHEACPHQKGVVERTRGSMRGEHGTVDPWATSPPRMLHPYPWVTSAPVPSGDARAVLAT